MWSRIFGGDAPEDPAPRGGGGSPGKRRGASPAPNSGREAALSRVQALLAQLRALQPGDADGFPLLNECSRLGARCRKGAGRAGLHAARASLRGGATGARPRERTRKTQARAPRTPLPQSSTSRLTSASCRRMRRWSGRCERPPCRAAAAPLCACADLACCQGAPHAAAACALRRPPPPLAGSCRRRRASCRA